MTKAPENRHKVFVYGTLKRGYRNHCLLEGQTFVGPAVTRPLYTMHDCGSYPCLVRGSAAVEGEIYAVSGECLARLDRLEGVPHLYKRLPAEIDGQGDVQVYVYQHDVAGMPNCGRSWPRAV